MQGGSPTPNAGPAAAKDAIEAGLEGSSKTDLEPKPVASDKMEVSLSASSYSGTSRQSSMDMDKMIRPKRKRIDPEQLEVLLGLFAQTDTPSYELRDRIAAQLNMSNREVQVSPSG
jgi:hypothetical protein